MVNSPEAVKRSYTSELRRTQAAATRLRIIDAAHELFIRDGYGSVSIDEIADAAAIGRATVFNAVGGKASLLRAVYDVAIVGDDEPVPLPERPWAKRVTEAKDAYTLLQRYAHMITVIDERVAGIWEVMRGAASAHEDVRAHWEQIRDERSAGASRVVAMVLARGRLRRGLTDKAAADIVLVHIDPGLHHQLVTLQRWTSSQFETWLARTFQEQLLPPRR